MHEYHVAAGREEFEDLKTKDRLFFNANKGSILLKYN